MNISTPKLADWNKALSKVLATVGTDSFAENLVQALGGILDFDVCMIFAYGEDMGSVALYHNIKDDSASLLIDDYLTGPHILDPFYVAAISGRNSGFGAMRDLAPDQFYRSEFYRHHYIRTAIADEIGIFFPVSGGRTAVLSVTRQKPNRIFSEHEKQTFAATAPMIEALGSKHWSNSTQLDKKAQGDKAAKELETNSSMKPIQSVFDSFGANVLTLREREIITLILKGHSSLSISYVLNISAGTVKIHRKNAYGKLGVASQAELFSRFLSVLQEKLEDDTFA